MLVIVKIGTTSVANGISDISKQISDLINQGTKVVLVSSGAVRFGKIFTGIDPKESISFVAKQVMASIGQPIMMKNYQDEFSKYNIKVSQILISKKDVESRNRYLNIASLISESLKFPNLLPIINENDPVCGLYQNFTDNDEIAGLIASQLDADKLIILTDVDGLYDDFQSPNRKIIHKISNDEQMPKIEKAKSNLSRGGMFSKANIGLRLSKIGITTHIVNAKNENILLRVVNSDEVTGTTILPQRKRNVGRKRWMSFLDKVKINGKVHLNAKLTDIIKNNVKRIDDDFAISILPVGITKLFGSFEKDDGICIIGYNGEILGIGIAAYSSSELKEYIGLNDKPIFMRHENLFIS